MTISLAVCVRLMPPNSHSSPCRPKPPGLDPLLLRCFFWIQLSLLRGSRPGRRGGEDGDDGELVILVEIVGTELSDWWRLLCLCCDGDDDDDGGWEEFGARLGWVCVYCNGLVEEEL